MNALYVPVFSGELGWEVINYAPHINYLVSKNNYKEVHIVVRSGREGLYPMGTHFYPIELSTKKSMGNSGADPPKNKVAKTMAKKFKVSKVSAPGRGMRFLKHRQFFQYKASFNYIKKWSGLPDNLVTLCIRGRKFGNHKNWSSVNWVKLCDYLVGLGLSPILSGIKEHVKFDLPKGCIDVRGVTDMNDLISIFHKSMFVIGQSTGPMHLASMCKVPHVVWGSSRIKSRYLNHWNPHSAIVEYNDCGKGFNCAVDSIFKTVDKMLLRI